MEQTLDDIIQQEIMRARAEALTRAGRSVEEALHKLEVLKEQIEQLKGLLEETSDRPESQGALIDGINDTVERYNAMRKYADLRYHYLIITREALGLRHHERVAEIYKIPPKMRRLRVQP